MKRNLGRKEAGVVVACRYPLDRTGTEVVAFETRGGGMMLCVSRRPNGKQRKRWPLVVNQRRIGNRWGVFVHLNRKETALLKRTLNTFTKEQAARQARQQEQEGVMWLKDIGKNQPK
ncbi:MAG: hypothetical protein AAB428_01230 [Patescibacteria group bacterium]